MTNNENRIFVTPEGLKKLQEEYKELTEERRAEVVQRIQKARELGDLTENAEYTAAREEQARIEGRILELGAFLKKAEVVKKKKNCQQVGIGCRVKVHLEGQDQEFKIVGATEADPSQGKISHESPLGHALLGKKIGDQIKVAAPGGHVVYKVLAVLF